VHNEGSFRFTALRDDRRDPVPLIRREITRSFPEEEGLGVALASGSQKAVSGADNLRLVMTNYGAQVTGSRGDDKWATWCQVGRARPMLRAGQLRNTMRPAAEAAGPPSERSIHTEGRPRASWHVTPLCVPVNAYVRDSARRGGEGIEDSGDVTSIAPRGRCRLFSSMLINWTSMRVSSGRIAPARTIY